MDSAAVTAAHGSDSRTATSRPGFSHAGEPLPLDARHGLEASYGHSLEYVRIHDDAESHELATDFDARAFALGPDIFFRDGQYRTDTPAGFELLAHEAAHTLQSAADSPTEARRVSEPNEASEQAARAAGQIATLGGRASVDASPAAAGTVHRWPWDDDAPAGGAGGGGGGGGGDGGGGLWDSIKSGASTALDWGNASGKAIHDAESSAWSATKSVAGSASDAYNAVAPDFNKSNQDLGKLVNMGEGWIHGLTKQATDATKDIPVLGSMVQGTAMIADVATDLSGGALKGAGDLVAGAGNAMFHPFDAAAGMAGGILGMAEHTPGFPGTMLKGAHGAYDIATGNEKGEYGKNWGELWNHMTDSDQANKDDLKFWAGLGGGEKAWQDNPLDAAARTGVNILPFFLGEVAGEGGVKGPAVPEGPLKPGGAPAFEGPGPKAPFEPPGLKGPLEPPSSGPVTKPYDPAFFDKPPETRPYDPSFFDKPGTPGEPSVPGSEPPSSARTYKPTGSRGDWAWDPSQYPGEPTPSAPPGFENQPRPYPLRQPTPVPPDFGFIEEPPFGPGSDIPPTKRVPFSPIELVPDTIPEGPQGPKPPRLPGDPLSVPPEPQQFPRRPLDPTIPREEPPSGPVDTPRQPPPDFIDPDRLPKPPEEIPDGPITQDAPKSNGSDVPTLRGLGGPLPAIPRGMDPGAWIQLALDTPGGVSVVELMRQMGMPISFRP